MLVSNCFLSGTAAPAGDKDPPTRNIGISKFFVPTDGIRLLTDRSGDFGASPFFGQLSASKALDRAQTLRGFRFAAHARLGDFLTFWWGQHVKAATRAAKMRVAVR
jgi:hypothetical protein